MKPVTLKPKSYKLKARDGYIALTSAIIISVLLLAITVSIGFSGFFGRINILDAESKEKSLMLAEACADTALLNLAKGIKTTGAVAVGSDDCSIVSVTTDGGQVTIKTQAIINRAYSSIQVVVDTNSFAILSWEELPNF